MMKKGIYAILAVLAVFALVLTGCPDGDNNKDDTKETYTVTFDAKGGTPIPDPITGLKSGDTITRPPNPTKENFDFDGWYKEEAYTTRWIFGSSGTAVTGNITLYAKWKADVGTTISKIIIDGIDIDTLAGADMGYSADKLADVEEGKFEPGRQQPPQGVTIVITPKNGSAIVTWAVKSNTPADTDFVSDTPVKFAEGDKLYIKVVKDENTAYYVIRVFFITSATINYGQPVINGKVIDSLWEEANYNGPDIQITRIASAETTANYKFLHTVDGTKAHTLGSAKAYWDDEGLYIYATIEFHDYYEEAAPTTPVTRVLQKRGNFESDSLEIMLNTRYQKLLADPSDVNYGQQYRVGFSDGDSSQASNTFPSKSVPAEKFVIGSGNHNTLPPGVQNTDIRDAFQQSGDYYAWEYSDTKGKGYKVICRVPWYLIGYDQTDQVFDMTTGLVKPDAKIGLEFQINASTSPAGTAPSRDGLLTWNSVTSQSVTNVTNYGVVTLAMGSNPRVVKTHAPVIRTQPKLNGSAISVEAIVGPTVPTGVLTYQWYQANDATADGVAVTTGTGGTTATYTVADATAATGKYFYVVVTNTNSAAAVGNTTASVTSRRVEFKYIAPDIVLDNPTITGVGGVTADTTGAFTLGANNTGITYQFPTTPDDLMTTYKTVQVSYTSTNNATGTRKIMVRQGYNNTSTGIAAGNQYPSLSDSGIFTWNLASDFTTNKDGFTLQTNTDDGGGATPASSNFTIKITRIVFSAQ